MAFTARARMVYLIKPQNIEEPKIGKNLEECVVSPLECHSSIDSCETTSCKLPSCYF